MTIKKIGFELEQLVARAIHSKLQLVDPEARLRVLETVQAYVLHGAEKQLALPVVDKQLALPSPQSFGGNALQGMK